MKSRQLTKDGKVNENSLELNNLIQPKYFKLKMNTKNII